jgi:hypothetical protein
MPFRKKGASKGYPLPKEIQLIFDDALAQSTRTAHDSADDHATGNALSAWR